MQCDFKLHMSCKALCGSVAGVKLGVGQLKLVVMSLRLRFQVLRQRKTKGRMQTCNWGFWAHCV